MSTERTLDKLTEYVKVALDRQETVTTTVQLLRFPTRTCLEIRQSGPGDDSILVVQVQNILALNDGKQRLKHILNPLSQQITIRNMN